MELLPNEAKRLAALVRYGILDTEFEESFDRLTRLAANLFSTSIALVSLVDGHRQWFKSAYGLSVRETPRELAFCAHAICGTDVFVVPNACEDPRFANNPLVTDAPSIRFYAGAPLITHDGYALGTMCIIDRTPRSGLTEREAQILKDLAAIAMDEIEYRYLLKRVQKIFDNSLIGIALYRPNRKWIEINARLCQMFGYSREELDALTWVDLTHLDDLAQNLRLFEQAVAQKTDTYGMRKRFIRKDGSILHAEINVQCIRHLDGSPDYFLLLVQDISERIKAESELHRVHKLDAIGQLTGGVAHDFNNLLQVILGNAEAMFDDVAVNSPLRHSVELIQRAAGRGAELTKQLLAFARRQPLESRELDLNTLIASVEPLLRRTLGEHIDIRTHFATGLPLIKADPAQLESALLNLAVNARDAMPTGGTLTIETASAHLDEHYCLENPDVTPGPYVLLAVSDTGTGMAPDVLVRVFEPFFTTKEVGKGTGLGLSMVYGFVKQSGGHAKIYSAVGHGTTVKLYFPQTAATAETAPSSAAPPQEPLPRGSETVLVVEDDAMVRAYVVSQLRSLGYSVIETADAKEAMATLEAGMPIDLVFSDVVMPRGMTGHQLAAEVRQRYPAIRVVLTSGYAYEAVKANTGVTAVAAILVKPYRRTDLARVIREALESRG